MITLLDRYLIRTVVGYSALVMAVLMALAGLFLFIGQQDDIGEGSYSALDALMFTLFNLPQQAFDMLPVGVLLGSMLGLGALARGSELVVVRAAGISVARVARAVALGGLLLAVFAALLGEFVAPPLQKFARQQKTFSKYSDISLAGKGGAWVKDGNTIISVQEQSGEDLFGGVYVFRFDGQRRLESIARAESAAVQMDAASWQLQRYAETSFVGDGTRVVRQASRTLNTTVDPGFLGVAVSQPRQLSSSGLWRLIRHLEANKLDARSYEFALWSRLARTVAVIIVAMLAVPFAFGSLRSAGAGARLVVGVLIGVGFFFLQRMFESGTIVFDLNPVILAWMPTALLGALTAGLVWATR